MATTELITTSFELTNGKRLVCEYTLYHLPGNFDYPDEWDKDSPLYTLGGKPVEISALPKGLEAIAESLYEADPGEYNYRSEPY